MTTKEVKSLVVFADENEKNDLISKANENQSFDANPTWGSNIAIQNYDLVILVSGEETRILKNRYGKSST